MNPLRSIRRLRVAFILAVWIVTVSVFVRFALPTVIAASPLQTHVSEVALTAAMQRAVALAVLTEVSTNTIHGYDDEAMSHADLASKLDGGEPLTLTCGYVSLFAQTMLSEVGIESRRVAFLTKDEFDGNNGHTAMEVRIGDSWYFTDPDFGRFYEQPASSLKAGRGAWVQIGEQYADPEDAPIFPRHVDGGVIGIEDGERIYFDCEDMRPDLVDHVVGYNPAWYACLSHEEWLARFYGQS